MLGKIDVKLSIISNCNINSNAVDDFCHRVFPPLFLMIKLVAWRYQNIIERRV